MSQPQPPAVPPTYGPPPGLQQPAYPAQNFGQPAAHPTYPPQNFTELPTYPGAGDGRLPMASCRFCGSVPAVSTTFRGHQGMIVLMRFLRMEGPFCRDCGLGTFRLMTSRTLVQGWYGYGSFIITPITVLINLVRRNKVAKLPPPQPNPFGPSRPPMNPGKRLLARPMTWFGLCVPLVVLGLILIAVFSDG